MSKIAEYRELEAQIQLQAARLEELRPKYEATEVLVDLILSEAKEKGLDLESIALAIAPHLGRASAKNGAMTSVTRTPRKARVVKKYKNPHSGETVETKGGNHRVLKEWKAQYGADVVEGWLE
ncbi:histone-like nucleoid-structuring protein, MvaT/MvaU family [Pseudomonas taiwanensis]|uniref:histone-like nucleoid-structuring protein, MvaT/MvaU family n=1 Tax=Pseudomonas taiwanensis TaxID=470150 RepID=UPI0028DE27BA|nr:histone-like nucleoid-structuring protein, MvaT/MvaU family [Pseudomonas taiwanensis]MDT8925047.1 histone-like nucleoid-structuring protein, MvaT/MvaU family [Pseudomonas taiwanensis]